MFSSRISLKKLALICRSLSSMLTAGIDLQKALELSGKKAGDPKIQHALQEVSLRIQKGDNLGEALERDAALFPTMFLEMVSVADQTGMLPEIFAKLADHYENNLRLRKKFLAAITFPVIQLIAAIFIIGGAIFLIGLILQGNQGVEFDVFGLGTGPEAAIKWFSYTFGFFALLFVAYHLVNNMFQQKRVLDTFLIQIPLIGSCMRSFAIARFSWAFYLTQQTGMRLDRSLESSLKATSNGAFLAAIPLVKSGANSGEEIGEILTASGLFPRDYLEMVQVAETSGTVPEALDRLSPQLEEDAQRHLSALTAAAGWSVWILVAGFIIFFIFRVVLFYVNMINDLTNEAMGQVKLEDFFLCQTAGSLISQFDHFLC